MAYAYIYRHLYCCSIYGKYMSSLLLFYLWQIRVISTAVLSVANTCHLYCCSICGKYMSSLLLFYLWQIRVISTAVLSVANTCHLYCCSICGKYTSSLLLFCLRQIHVISTGGLSEANKHCKTCCIYVRQSCSQFSSLISFFHSLLGFCCVFFVLVSFFFLSLFLSLQSFFSKGYASCTPNNQHFHFLHLCK